jgi:hypothetical protein
MLINSIFDIGKTENNLKHIKKYLNMIAEAEKELNKFDISITVDYSRSGDKIIVLSSVNKKIKNANNQQ